MEIEITSFVRNAKPFEFSASVAERGQNAGRETWSNAVAQGAAAPLLKSPAELQAIRDWAKATGAWDAAEIAAWDDAECNALFIQLVSGDMREAGMENVDLLAEFDWDEYENRAQEGQISGNIFMCPVSARVYYNLDS
jgi:hypothetical protein